LCTAALVLGNHVWFNHIVATILYLSPVMWRLLTLM